MPFDLRVLPSAVPAEVELAASRPLYMAYSGTILIPIFLLVTLVFFR